MAALVATSPLADPAHAAPSTPYPAPADDEDDSATQANAGIVPLSPLTAAPADGAPDSASPTAAIAATAPIGAALNTLTEEQRERVEQNLRRGISKRIEGLLGEIGEPCSAESTPMRLFSCRRLRGSVIQ